MTKPRKLKPATVAEIRSLIGDRDDDAVLAIWRTEATSSDIMQALNLTGGGYWNCISRPGGQLITPIVRAVQDILDAYSLQDDEIA